MDDTMKDARKRLKARDDYLSHVWSTDKQLNDILREAASLAFSEGWDARGYWELIKAEVRADE